MKIRHVFVVAIVVAASAACQSSPTAPRAEDSHSPAGIDVRLDGSTAPSDSTTRAGGGGAAGSGN